MQYKCKVPEKVAQKIETTLKFAKQKPGYRIFSFTANQYHYKISTYKDIRTGIFVYQVFRRKDKRYFTVIQNTVEVV